MPLRNATVASQWQTFHSAAEAMAPRQRLCVPVVGLVGTATVVPLSFQYTATAISPQRSRGGSAQWHLGGVCRRENLCGHGHCGVAAKPGFTVDPRWRLALRPRRGDCLRGDATVNSRRGTTGNNSHCEATVKLVANRLHCCKTHMRNPKNDCSINFSRVHSRRKQKRCQSVLAFI